MVYLCNAAGESGGIKVLYDHVRHLREGEVDAWLGSEGPFERCRWFDHEPACTPSISGLADRLGEEDVLVIPEYAVRDPAWRRHSGRQRAFVQNLSLISGPLDEHRFEAVLVPSRVLIEPLRRETGYRGPISVVPGFLEPEWIRPPRRFVRGEPEILLVDREGKHEGQPLRVGTALVAAGWRVSTVRPPLTRAEFVANSSPPSPAKPTTRHPAPKASRIETGKPSG
ncbi:MAG: hypothetical protein AAFZ65_15185 [Planctomycetota bacterium]